MKKLIDKDGCYKTKSDIKLGFFYKNFPTISAYINLMRIFFYGYYKSRRFKYGEQEFIKISRDILTTLENVGVKFKITGINNFRYLESPCVFIGNHMSMLETFVLPCLIEPFKRFTFVIKKSLARYPILKHLILFKNPILITNNPRRDLEILLKQGGYLLESGTSIIVFPEGSRTYPFDPNNFNKIGIKLAAKAGVPVIPIALKTNAWGNGKIFKDLGRIDPNKPVHFAFGEPLKIKMRGERVHQKVIDFITERQLQWSKY